MKKAFTHYRTLTILAIVVGLVGSACSSNQAACEAGQSLESSINELSGLVGVEDPEQLMRFVDEDIHRPVGELLDLESAIDAAQGDLDVLVEAAPDAAADEVDALEQAMDDLTDAISELINEFRNSSFNTDFNNAEAAQDANQGVATAAQAVYDTLTDCS